MQSHANEERCFSLTLVVKRDVGVLVVLSVLLTDEESINLNSYGKVLHTWAVPGQSTEARTKLDTTLSSISLLIGVRYYPWS